MEGISDFWISGQSVINENSHNSRTSSHNIDLKLGPAAKLDKRNPTTSENLKMISCGQIVMLLSFFQFMANLEPPGNQIPDAWSIKFTFSLIVPFILQKL